MSSTFEATWPVIKEHEGSKFTNIKGDPGGATKWGITLRNAQLHNLDIDHDGDTDIDDIKNLTEEEAKAYYHEFWWRPLYEKIDEQALATKLFDTCINTGDAKATIWLQQVINKLSNFEAVKVDGLFGMQTLIQLNKFHADIVLEEYRALQADFYRRWVNAKYDERHKFLEGLLNRARS